MAHWQYSTIDTALASRLEPLTSWLCSVPLFFATSIGFVASLGMYNTLSKYDRIDRPLSYHLIAK